MPGSTRGRWSRDDVGPYRAMEVDTSPLPVALDGALGYAAHGADLRERKAAEELQINELREQRVDLGQLVDSIAYAAQGGSVGLILENFRIERGDLELPAAFLRPVPPGVLDDQAA